MKRYGARGHYGLQKEGQKSGSLHVYTKEGTLRSQWVYLYPTPARMPWQSTGEVSTSIAAQVPVTRDAKVRGRGMMSRKYSFLRFFVSILV